MLHLKSITVREFSTHDKDTFPFDLEIVKSLREIQFTSPVTFFVGENGSGKSTVMEAIACAVESITVGSESVKTDKTLAPVRKLAQYFYPQRQTQVMNEGWATFWHYTILQTMFERGLVNEGFMFEFLMIFKNVVIIILLFALIIMQGYFINSCRK